MVEYQNMAKQKRPTLNLLQFCLLALGLIHAFKLLHLNSYQQPWKKER
jgi:hypothetical protein